MSKKFPFAKRTDWPLVPNELGTILDGLKANQTNFIDLTESNPTRCGFDYPKDLILNPLVDAKNLSYDPSPRGSAAVRETISAYYKAKGFHVPAEQIFLTASSSEAYSFLFRLLVNPTERVFFPKPSYPLFQYFVDLNDIEVSYYPLVYTNGKWRIAFEQLKEGFLNETRAIVLVNPNNPTGSYIHHDELDLLNELCAREKTAIISDEVFADFAFDKQYEANSLAENKKVLTFVLGGLSKSLALPQMKLSWIVVQGPKEIVSEAMDRLEVIADTYLSVNTPVQNAASEWLKQKNVIQDQVNSRLRTNLDYLKKKFNSLPEGQVLEPQGGWYALVKLPKDVDEEDWVLRLLKEKHVFVHPGYFFDFDEPGHIVISLLPTSEKFQKGIDLIAEAIKSG